LDLVHAPQKDADFSFGVHKAMDKSGSGALWKLGPSYAFGCAAIISAAAFVFFISHGTTPSGKT
jgi:hypothetical protein